MPLAIESDERMPKKRLVLYEDLTFYKTFHVELEFFKFEKKTRGTWTNLLHFTVGENNSRPGDRTPGAFFIELIKYIISTLIQVVKF